MARTLEGPDIDHIELDDLLLVKDHFTKDELKDRKKMFEREARNYLLDEGKINRYRKFFGDHPLTIRREENNEDSKQSEYVLDALHSIDVCFVNDDAAGIKAIRKRAKEEPALSNRDKMKIISECGLALSELKGVSPATEVPLTHNPVDAQAASRRSPVVPRGRT